MHYQPVLNGRTGIERIVIAEVGRRIVVVAYNFCRNIRSQTVGFRQPLLSTKDIRFAGVNSRTIGKLVRYLAKVKITIRAGYKHGRLELIIILPPAKRCVRINSGNINTRKVVYDTVGDLRR